MCGDFLKINGCGDTRGTHLSVYGNILCGEFNNQLRCLFDGRITVEEYNRTTKHTVVMNEKNVALRTIRDE